VIRDSEAETVVVHPDFAAVMQAVHLPPATRTVTTDERWVPLSAPRSRGGGTAARDDGLHQRHHGQAQGRGDDACEHRGSGHEPRTAWEWRVDDWILLVLPLHHVHGIINVLSCALWVGARCEMVAKFDAELAWGRIAAGELTLFMAVPTIYGS